MRLECSAYLDSRPYELVGRPQPEGEEGKGLLVWKVHRPPPLRLSVLLGDLLHNLRSSLDHIAWQLVLANGGTPGRGTSFPILLTKKATLKIAGRISKQAAAVVEDLQPYNNKSGVPEIDPLHILGTLNNIDKHREINIAVLNVTDMLEAHLMTEDGTGIYMTFQLLDNVGKDKPIVDGAVVGRTPCPAADGQKWVIGVESRLGLQETNKLSQLGSPTLFNVAEEILEYVRDIVVPEFERII